MEAQSLTRQRKICNFKWPEDRILNGLMAGGSQVVAAVASNSSYVLILTLEACQFNL